MKIFGQMKNQYYTAFFGNFLSIGYGMIIGWASPSLPLLQSDKSPLSSGPVTNDEAAWISSFLCIGNLIGTLVIGWIVDRFGRKVAVYVTALPLIISWFLIALGTNVLHLYIARLVGGFVGGGSYIVIPMYISEIADENIRGSLGSLIQVAVNFGIVLAFIAGAFLDYYVFTYISVIIPMLFLVAFCFIPESPIYLLAKDRIEEAEQSFRFFHGCSNNASDLYVKDIKNKFEKLKLEVKCKNANESNFTVKDFVCRSSRRAIMISAVLVLTTQLSGMFYVINYSSILFAEAGSHLSPNNSSIIVAFLNFFGSALAPFFVDKSGRKNLLIHSSFWTGTCLSVLGGYSYLKTIGVDVSSYLWVPIGCMSGAVFISAWGIITLPYLIVAEILPHHIRGVVKTFFRSFLSIVGFLLLKYHYWFTESLGLYGCMWLFAGFCFFETIFVICYLPETKGKCLEEIILMLQIKKN